MATLTRPRPVIAQAQIHPHSILDSSIPSPFPAEVLNVEREQQAALDILVRNNAGSDPFADQSGEQQAVEVSVSVESLESDELQSQTGFQEHVEDSTTETELGQTLACVQQSCLMALNNLLSAILSSSANWQPIVPIRRHSMPSRPGDTSPNETSSALCTLVENFRSNDSTQMSEASSSSSDDSSLIAELQRRVEAMSHELSPPDSQLSLALISLIAHANRLATIDPMLAGARAANVTSVDALTARPQFDIYDQLSRQVLDLQNQRLDRTADGLMRDIMPQRKVEISLLWAKVDQGLEAVSHLCRQRNEPAPIPYSPDLLPPDYDSTASAYEHHDDDDSLLPPDYESGYSGQLEKEKSAVVAHSRVQVSEFANEKMRMDLEAVTMAIDRLYLVAPQLHNQRVELRKSKLDELERARLAGPSSDRNRSAKGKEKQKDVRELEKIVDLLGKASNRRLDDQSVELNPDMQIRIERSRQRNKAKREAFVEHLLSHSDSRRINSQDATFQSEVVKDGEALLTLPEFIREKVPEEYQQQLEPDPEALVTLQEIVKEPPPPKTPKHTPSTESFKQKQRHFKSFTNRNRSLSAPPLAWLLPSLSRSSSSTRLSQQASDGSSALKKLTVRYVAEHHENLNHVLVFIGVDEGMTAGQDLEADVIPSVGDPTVGDKFILKCGITTSSPLRLPAAVPAGKLTIQVQGTHYEVKIQLDGSGTAIRTPPSRSSISRPFTALHRRDAVDRKGGSMDSSQLLDAAQMADMDPTSFICASCSSALVQTQAHGHGADKRSKGLSYLDLPSEHWEELLEAWMCHTDQKLSERMARHGKGFWPKTGQAFVGGSYFLFDQSAVVSSNLRIVGSTKGDEWQRVQCICGAVIGRYRTYTTDGDEARASVYRIPKYAIRPISLTSEPIRVPFSAFILEDMLELVRAHATYRFIILDEEEERSRLLIWLFKPHMRLSYATTAQYTLPRTGSVDVSKVLFKILQVGSDISGSSTPIPSGVRSPPASPHSPFNLESILSKYPGFPQAERLLYPRDVCQRLAALLKESNTAYPMGVRVMTGLLTGWLQRS